MAIDRVLVKRAENVLLGLIVQPRDEYDEVFDVNVGDLNDGKIVCLSQSRSRRSVVRVARAEALRCRSLW